MWNGCQCGYKQQQHDQKQHLTRNSGTALQASCSSISCMDCMHRIQYVLVLCTEYDDDYDDFILIMMTLFWYWSMIIPSRSCCCQQWLMASRYGFMILGDRAALSPCPMKWLSQSMRCVDSVRGRCFSARALGEFVRPRVIRKSPVKSRIWLFSRRFTTECTETSSCLLRPQ